MAELEANFTLNNEQNIDALFEIYASGTTWGNISGDISNQTDLKDALDTLQGQITDNHEEIGSIGQTLGTYGDIVTYNASDFATSIQGGLADTAIQPGDNITELVNNAGYITTSALNGYATETWVNNKGYITGINSTDVISALGYTPYDSNNPDGYITSSALTNYIINTATGSQSIGAGQSSAASGTGSISYGYDAEATSTYSTAIGWGSRASNTNTIAIGKQAKATKARTIAIGTGAEATADDAIVIKGINNTANTFQVSSYTLLDTSTGLIPDARISSNIARSADIPSIANCVTTNTAQTISASKAFSQPLVIADNNGLASGTLLSSKKILQRSSGDNTLTLNNKDNKLRLVGSETRPKYSADGTNYGDLALYSDFTAIDDLIPAQATISNQLADKAFVNSSIATNTANFIGTFSDITTLEAYAGTVTNNDYAFVVNSVVTDNGNDWANFAALDAYDKTLLTNFDYAWVINGANFDLYRFDIVNQDWSLRVSDTAKADVTLNTAYNRYKATVSGNTVTWDYEYTLNNSSFTAAQWAAINSGITSGDVSLIGTALQPNDNISTLNNDSGYITGIDSTDVTTALGYTPYNSSNPNGYTSNVGTVTSVNNTSPDGSGNVTLSIPAAQVQSDWAQTDNTDVDYIKNKPYIPYFATSTSAADAVQKEVSIPSITSLQTGQIIVVQPTITSTVANSTIKLNNFTAYPMRYNNAAVTTTTDSVVWSSAYVSAFVFDGTYWQFLCHGLDSNTTYSLNYSQDAGVYKLGTGSYVVTRYSLMMQKADMTWEKITNPNASYSTATTKTVNTNGFRLGQIKYYSSTSNFASGATIPTNAVYDKAATVDLRYSTNCGNAPAWTAGDYIYLVGTMGADGLFYLDTTTWWTNTLPNTNDGKLYIRLGIFLSDAKSSMLTKHPVFYHNGNRICEYIYADNMPVVNDATLTLTQGGVTKGTFTANASSNVTIDLDAGGGGATIDDTTPSSSTVYSSQKTQDLIDALVARIMALENNINGGNA